jgi:hypothetical protein
MAGNTKTFKMWQQAVSATEDCLPLEVLERMTENNSIDTKAAAHLASCPHCQTELSMLRSFETSAPSADEGAAVAWIAAQLERRNATSAKPAVPRVPFWRTMFRVPYLAGAAALVVVVALGISMHNNSGSHPVQIGGGGNYVSSEFRTGAIHLLTPVGDISQAPSELRWDPYTGASNYSVELKDSIGVVITSTKTTQNFITLTPQMKANMLSGKPMKWKVTALDANGKEMANSSGGDFRIN